MRGSFITQIISVLLLTFFPPRVKRKKIIKTQKPIIAVKNMSVTEGGTSMIDEDKKKA
jgi:hypothetical protein